MSFCWKTMSLARLVLHHSLKWMESHLIIIEEIMVVDMDVVGIKENVLKIFQEKISHPTTESGITMKQNNMEMEEVYKINPQKPMKKNVISVVWKGIGYIPAVRLNIWWTYTKSQLKGIKINFTNLEDHNSRISCGLFWYVK